MNTTITDIDALRHLGMVIHKIRPQWDPPGIRAALENAANHPYADLALVAISSARDPSARTPAVIPQRCANGWMTTAHDERMPPTHQPDSTTDMRCRSCGLWTVRGENHVCARPADPATIAEIRQRIRQETP